MKEETAQYNCPPVLGDSLWVLLVDDTQAGRPFQVRVDDHDLRGVLLLAGLAQYCANSLAELNPTSATLLGAAHEELGVHGGLDSTEDIGATRMTGIEVCDGGFPAEQSGVRSCLENRKETNTLTAS